MIYYSGIYQSNGDKVLQVSDDKDGLNCEITEFHISQPELPCHIRFKAITAGEFMNCTHVELNMTDNYELIPLS